MRKNFISTMKWKSVQDLQKDPHVESVTVSGETFYIETQNGYSTVYNSDGQPLHQSNNTLKVIFSGTQPVIVDNGDQYTLDGHLVLHQQDQSTCYVGSEEERI